jgi:hypothetical protein
MRTSGVQLIHFQVFWPKRPHIVLLNAAKHLAITNVRAHALTYPLDDVEHLEGGLQIEASNRLTPYSTPGCHVRVPPTAVLQTRGVASFFWGRVKRQVRGSNRAALQDHRTQHPSRLCRYIGLPPSPPLLKVLGTKRDTHVS